MTHETLNESAQAGHEINNLVQTFDHCTDGYPASVVLKPAPAPQYESTSKKVNGQPVWTGKLSRSRERVLLEPLKTKKADALFRQLDGRSVPRERARRVDRPGLRHHGADAAEHLSAADQARGADAGLLRGGTHGAEYKGVASTRLGSN